MTTNHNENEKAVQESVWEALREVIDPELQVNVVDLGLIYDVDVWPENRIQITMTMTTPACPLSGYLKGAVETAVHEALTDVNAVIVNVVWSPAWSPALITPAGLEQLEANRRG